MMKNIGNQQVLINDDGTVDVLTGGTRTTLTQQSADLIFRTVLARNVEQDVLDYAEDQETGVTEEEAKEAGMLYANDGEYDCSLDYWTNIANLIRKAKEAVKTKAGDTRQANALKEEQNIRFLDTVAWHTESGDSMYCYMAYAADPGRMAYKDRIHENMEEGSPGCYLQFEVSFNRDKELKEVHVLIQDELEGGWGSLDAIGEETSGPDGSMTGHTLLSDGEFAALTGMARRKLEEDYGKFDWEAA